MYSDLPTPMRGRSQPMRDAVARSDRLHLLKHPLAGSLVTMLRNIETPRRAFEWATHELTRALLWQALEPEPSEPMEVTGFSGERAPGTRLRRRLATLAIMRAGIGMVPPVQALLPEAPAYLIGIRRDEATLEPHFAYANLPASFSGIEHILLLDPMLATGGSACMALRTVRERFTGDLSFIGLLGAPAGVERLLNADPTIAIYLAALDDHLNNHGYIIPGLGDAGDRIFGTN